MDVYILDVVYIKSSTGMDEMIALHCDLPECDLWVDVDFVTDWVLVTQSNQNAHYCCTWYAVKHMSASAVVPEVTDL